MKGIHIVQCTYLGLPKDLEEDPGMPLLIVDKGLKLGFIDDCDFIRYPLITMSAPLFLQDTEKTFNEAITYSFQYVPNILFEHFQLAMSKGKSMRDFFDAVFWEFSLEELKNVRENMWKEFSSANNKEKWFKSFFKQMLQGLCENKDSFINCFKNELSKLDINFDAYNKELEQAKAIIEQLPEEWRIILEKRGVEIALCDYIYANQGVQAYGIALYDFGRIGIVGHLEETLMNASLKEEVIHYIDQLFDFTDKKQWREAARKDVSRLSESLRDYKLYSNVLLDSSHKSPKFYGNDEDIWAQELLVDIEKVEFALNNNPQNKRLEELLTKHDNDISASIHELFPNTAPLYYAFREELKHAAVQIIKEDEGVGAAKALAERLGVGYQQAITAKVGYAQKAYAKSV